MAPSMTIDGFLDDNTAAPCLPMIYTAAPLIRTATVIITEPNESVDTSAVESAGEGFGFEICRSKEKLPPE